MDVRATLVAGLRRFCRSHRYAVGMEPVIPRWHLGAVRRAVSKSVSDLVSLRVPSYAEYVVADDGSGYRWADYICELWSFIEWSRGIRVVADLDDALAETESMDPLSGARRDGGTPTGARALRPSAPRSASAGGNRVSALVGWRRHIGSV